jgi:hypothetical protein
MQLNVSTTSILNTKGKEICKRNKNNLPQIHTFPSYSLWLKHLLEGTTVWHKDHICRFSVIFFDTCKHNIPLVDSVSLFYLTFFFFFGGIGFKLTALCLIGKYSTALATLSALFSIGYSQDRVLWIICQAGFETWSFWSLPSWVAKIIGLSHRRPALLYFFVSFLAPNPGLQGSACPISVFPLIFFLLAENQSHMSPFCTSAGQVSSHVRTSTLVDSSPWALLASSCHGCLLLHSDGSSCRCSLNYKASSLAYHAFLILFGTLIRPWSCLIYSF